jgi:hypothetical protein
MHSIGHSEAVAPTQFTMPVRAEEPLHHEISMARSFIPTFRISCPHGYKTLAPVRIRFLSALRLMVTCFVTFLLGLEALV